MYSRDDGEEENGMSGKNGVIKPDAYYQYTLKGMFSCMFLCALECDVFQ